MVQIAVDKEIDAPASEVWALLSNFGDISWVPGMDHVTSEGEGAGMLRKIAVGEGPPVVERLDSINNETMTWSYSILSGNSMPIEDLKGGGTVKVLDENRCVLTWTASGTEAGVDEQQAATMLCDFYTGLLDIVENAVTSD